MSLLNTKTGFTTPWHCSVALLADGEWISAPMGDFMKDSKLEIVYEDGRPSYFQEKTRGLQELINSNKSTSNQKAAKRLNGHCSSISFDKEAIVNEPVEILEHELLD